MILRYPFSWVWKCCFCFVLFPFIHVCIHVSNSMLTWLSLLVRMGSKPRIDLGVWGTQTLSLGRLKGGRWAVAGKEKYRSAGQDRWCRALEARPWGVCMCFVLSATGSQRGCWALLGRQSDPLNRHYGREAWKHQMEKGRVKDKWLKGRARGLSRMIWLV